MDIDIRKTSLGQAGRAVRPLLLGAGLMGALALAVSGTLHLLGGLTCENRVLVMANSPDGAHKAYVFRRDCGHADSASTQVSVLPASAAPPDGAGNAFITDTDEVLVRWQSPDRLSITRAARARVSLSEHLLNGINVSYE